MAKKDTPQADDIKQDYVVQSPFWYGTRLLEKGDPISLTDAQAKYYVPHQLKLKDAKQAPKRDEPTPSKTTQQAEG